jgi:hypothetical protein
MVIWKPLNHSRASAEPEMTSRRPQAQLVCQLRSRRRPCVAGCSTSAMTVVATPPTHLQRAKVFLAAGDYRAVEVAGERFKHPSARSYLYLTYAIKRSMPMWNRQGKSRSMWRWSISI